ncbi:MAG: acylphosphatase [Bacteroidales bacterium]|nr:acylphosphatase [Bacteroidales bacterium]
MKTIQIKVSGRVQGVGFRYYTQKKALEFNIFGFVQNKPDGSVYIEAEGKDIDVDTFADWCARGPSWAKVLQYKKSELPLAGFTQFEIK